MGGLAGMVIGSGDLAAKPATVGHMGRCISGGTTAFRATS